MTTLAADTQRNYSDAVDPWFEELDIIAADTIYEGAAVGANTSGYMRPLVSGDMFRGFAEKQAANESGSAGDVRVKLRRQGVVQLAVTGATARTDVGLPVFATDDNTFTITNSGGSRVGTIAKWVTSTTCLVYFEAEQKATHRRPRQVTKTGDYTILAGDDGTEFNNLGASGTVIFTLPAASALLIGMKVKVRACVASQTVTLAGTAGELITFNDAAANSVSFQTSSEIIGGELEATCVSATKWFISIRAEETQTVTIAT